MNHSRLRALALFLAGGVISVQALSLHLGSLSNANAVSGLKDALTQGSASAVSKPQARIGETNMTNLKHF